MEPIIVAKDICRSFPVGDTSLDVLRGINLEIFPNALTVICGRSGAGKTTLMNILGVLDQPTSGQVFYEGTDIFKAPERFSSSLRRTQIGFVFQSVALIGMMTAAENVEFAMRMAGVSIRDRAERTQECLQMVGLGGKGAHMPQELSGGECQRVAIARAMAHRPQIIFADEPTAELDSLTGLHMVKIFQQMAKTTTMIIATHDDAVVAAADYVYEIEDGIIK